MSNEPTERKKWFIKQVGKVLFSTKTACSCLACIMVYNNGRLVRNKEHAEYLFDWEGLEPMTFFLSRDARDAFEVDTRRLLEEQKTPAI